MVLSRKGIATYLGILENQKTSKTNPLQVAEARPLGGKTTTKKKQSKRTKSVNKWGGSVAIARV